MKIAIALTGPERLPRGEDLPAEPGNFVASAAGPIRKLAFRSSQFAFDFGKAFENPANMTAFDCQIPSTGAEALASHNSFQQNLNLLQASAGDFLFVLDRSGLSLESVLPALPAKSCGNLHEVFDNSIVFRVGHYLGAILIFRVPAFDRRKPVGMELGKKGEQLPDIFGGRLPDRPGLSVRSRGFVFRPVCGQVTFGRLRHGSLQVLDDRAILIHGYVKVGRVRAG